MTGTNPPHDRDQPGGQTNETQWWSTPPSNPGTPVTGTEPTVMGGGGHQGPVTGTDPTVLGAGFDNYLGTPQPQYPQQGQPQPGYPPQQPPPPYGGAPYGQPSYPAQPYRQPPKSGSATPWIIGGAVGLVVIVGVVIGIVALAGKDSGGGGGLPGTDKKTDGNYAMSTVTDACTLVDPTVLKKWAPTPDGANEHTERQPDSSYAGGSLECRAKYTGAGKYGSDDSTLDFEADFQSQYGSPDFNNWKDYDTKTTGSGRTSGTIAGLGQDAYYAMYEQKYSSFVTLDYTCAVLDSNLSAKVKLSIDSPAATNKDEVGTVCKEQLKKALTALHK
ncbi:hypothetical protein BJY24_002416 [Nocardia transvalensis]|uniref:DUF3558 domain-containing protein n=1 Tax=Nocardia transvalensis TaxID=37333 RepID=A0A7W9UHM7_9NOCA|nr:hypothetical protein [Nocardia transvalensis]MBB5913549.1 hypothetical protein [Nocardia transvalensis]